jgi:hypothetical protein
MIINLFGNLKPYQLEGGPKTAHTQTLKIMVAGDRCPQDLCRSRDILPLLRSCSSSFFALLFLQVGRLSFFFFGSMSVAAVMVSFLMMRLYLQLSCGLWIRTGTWHPTPHCSKTWLLCLAIDLEIDRGANYIEFIVLGTVDFFIKGKPL